MSTDELVRRGNPAVRLRIHAGGRTTRANLFDVGLDDTAYPLLLFVSQARTEEVLTEHLGGQGIEVERGIALETFSDDGERVTCHLAAGDGTREQVGVRCSATRPPGNRCGCETPSGPRLGHRVQRAQPSGSDRAFTVATSRHAAARVARVHVVPRLLPLALRVRSGGRAAFRTVSQLAVRYRSSPNVGEGRGRGGGALRRALSRRAGPRPGDRCQTRGSSTTGRRAGCTRR